MEHRSLEEPGLRHSYFAYGSNLNRADMAVRCPGAKPLGRARLEGWRLTFRGVADIEPARGTTVLGALWLLTAADLSSLDRYEGAPSLYCRRDAEVMSDAGPSIAITYVMCDQAYRGLPSDWYLTRIADGYRDWGLPRGPLDQALAHMRAELAVGGAVGFRPDGRKRLRAIEAEEEIDGAR
jgi:gamma-glutamylcyclotransferase (GGCT)/AIG2-like uncharacterized protein YtfP